MGINTNTMGYIYSNTGRKEGALSSQDDRKHMKIEEAVILELSQACMSSNKSFDSQRSTKSS